MEKMNIGKCISNFFDIEFLGVTDHNTVEFYEFMGISIEVSFLPGFWNLISIPIYEQVPDTWVLYNMILEYINKQRYSK